MLSNQQFDRMRQLALSLAGIELSERHRELLERRSMRLGIHDGAGLDLLLKNAQAGEVAATQKLIRLLTTRFTEFFRRPRHFEIATKHAARAAHCYGRARLWSVAAATGEEPYSLAMALVEAFQQNAPSISVLATDLDVDSLAIAQRGEYSELAIRPVGPARRGRFFVELTGRRWAIGPTVRSLIEFRALNLVSPTWPVEGPFDVIFCRNVLMYLKPCHRYAVLQRMALLLAEDGLLFLDPTEHLGGAERLFTPGIGGVYSTRREAGTAWGMMSVSSTGRMNP